MDIRDWIRANHMDVTCRALTTLRDTGMIASIVSKYTLPAPPVYKGLSWWGYAGVAAQAAMALVGCTGPIPEFNTNETSECQSVNGNGQLWAKYRGTDGVYKVVKLGADCDAVRINQLAYLGNTKWMLQVTLKNRDVFTYTLFVEYGQVPIAYISPCPGSWCGIPGEKPDWYVPPGPKGDDYVTPPIGSCGEDTQCEWTITPIDAYIDQQGIYRTYYEVTPSDPCCGSTFYYWDADNGPLIDPPGGNPSPGGGNCEYPNITGTTYYLYGDCEDPEYWGMPEGQDYVEFTWEFPTQPAFQAIARRIDALAEMIDLSGAFATPTCGFDKCDLEGDWVTTRWESVEKSFESGRRLRKLFRYRSKSSRDLGELSAYWELFEWKAGPVCVIHKGASWGTPQVWAESEDEGKRVINFAAAEAGIDTSEDGEWVVKRSSQARTGLNGTMKIKRYQGFPWVAHREGSNWPNQLARKRDP